ncbi:MAG: transketolase [Peptostreptococcaceae bacterium]|nr:transketolase [Peptostreptococcaceae bacterium]
MDKEKIRFHARNIRANALKMIAKAGSGHPGGSLSIADILSVLYFDKMNVDPKDPLMEDRDRLVLSKGHAAPGLYATLFEKGYFGQEEMESLRQVNSMLQGHPDMKGTPGVDMTTGSLGQGLSTAVGMALGAKYKKSDLTVYSIIGDGEVQEGQIWEAAMAATHYKLNNLIVFLDHNGLQIDGKNEDVMGIEPIGEKFASFGWEVIAIDGHDIDQISDAVDKAKRSSDRPTLIHAKTVKGKGVSFMEDQYGWHGVAPKPEELEMALKELEK